MAGEPPRALEQPTMSSCTPGRVGAGRDPLKFFSFLISYRSFSREARQADRQFAFLALGNKQEYHGNPQSVQDTATRTKLFEVQEQNPEPFMTATDGLW